MSITAIVEDNIIRLPEGTCLPDGTRVIIERVKSPAEEKGSGLGGRLKQFVGIAGDVPSDLARNHDHYVHGQAQEP